MRGIQFLRLVGLAILGVFAMAVYPPTDAAPSAQEGLQQRLSALEGQVASLVAQVAELTQPLRIDVDCDAGERIQPALNANRFHPAPVTITVFGVCPENLVIPRRDLVIHGGAPGAGIASAASGRPVVSSAISSPTFVLAGLTLSGGTSGVLADFGAQVRLVNCMVRNNQTGILADHASLVRLENTVVEQNSVDGVLARNGATVYMTGGDVRSNFGVGIRLQTGSSADLANSALVTSNTVYGISVDGGGSLRLGAATITQNVLTGVFVSGGSSVYLEPGATITANLGSGISLMDTSLAQKFRGVSDIHITNNGAYGIVCSDPPAVAQIVGFTFETGDISGNPMGNIDCPISPGPKAQ